MLLQIDPCHYFLHTKTEQGTMCNPAEAHPLQAISDLTASLAARGVRVVVSEGAPLHIDFVNLTETRDLLKAAAKSYVDWYMLTQARSQPLICRPAHQVSGLLCKQSLALYLACVNGQGR